MRQIHQVACFQPNLRYFPGSSPVRPAKRLCAISEFFVFKGFITGSGDPFE